MRQSQRSVLLVIPLTYHMSATLYCWFSYPKMIIAVRAAVRAAIQLAACPSCSPATYKKHHLIMCDQHQLKAYTLIAINFQLALMHLTRCVWGFLCNSESCVRPCHSERCGGLNICSHWVCIELFFLLLLFYWYHISTTIEQALYLNRIGKGIC